jgi:hypothetical protein
MKDRDYVIQDNRKQGTRTDMQEAVSLVKESGMKALAQEKPGLYIRYNKGFSSLLSELQPERDFKPIVYWLYGPTGRGKTHIVQRLFGTSVKDVWYSSEDGKYWDGYNNQDVVVLDDFRKTFCPFESLLKILGQVPYNVNVKFGFRTLNSHWVFISAPFSPTKMYEDINEDVKQLTRRIKKVYHVASHKVADDVYLEILRDKVVYDLERFEMYKKHYVPPVSGLKVRVIIVRDWFKERNNLIHTFRQEYFKVKLTNATPFNFNSHFKIF